MKIQIDELTKEEYRKLFGVIELTTLRELVASDNKLVKKYIKGYRPEKTPPIELARIYYSEIKNGNSVFKRAFCSSISKWIKTFQNVFSEDDCILASSIEEAVEVGILLADRGLNVEFELFEKIVCWSGSEENRFVAKSVYERVNATYEKQRALYEEISCEKEIILGQLRQSEETAKRYQKSREKYKQEADIEKQRVDSLEQEVERLAEEKQSLQLKHSELEVNLDRCEKQIESQLFSLNRNDEKINQLIIDLQSVKDDNEKLVSKNKQLEEQKNFEFEKLISYLVEETISDLKIEYNLSKEKFNELVSNIDGPHNIVNVWDSMSKANQGLVEDIEAVMRNNTPSMEIIDMCDQAENYILVKYIILKAIKAIVFDAMSKDEKEKSLYNCFQ